MLFAVLWLVAVWAMADDKQAPSANSAAARTQSASASEVAQGEKKFQTHCGRCHNEPQQLSPAIAGTVLRHMRVRAMLSREDEQQILRYLAP
jgi:cytochrome c5